ncbi:MAG: hypothetical protein D6820_07895 [Lentisphaerae bacterium]|nr:MAG: hypothetical protein D6820_07895 [Lentisphaerota bacterium]
MLQEIEKEDTTVPALLHCDLKVMGKDGSIWADSFWAYQKLEPRVMADFNRVLVQNSVTGCAMVCNRALRDLAGDIPPEAVMHDWWLALIAASMGKLNFLCEPLIHYRQHDTNDTGAKQWGGKFIIDRLRQFFADRKTMRKSVQRTIRQARAFRQRFAGRLSADKLEILEAYCSLPEQPRLKRWRTVSRYGFWKYGLVRNLAYLLLL